MYDTRRDSQRIESKDVRSLSRIHFLRFTRYSWPFVTHPCKIFFEEGGYPVSIHCVISASTDARGSKNDFFSLSSSSSPLSFSMLATLLEHLTCLV